MPRLIILLIVSLAVIAGASPAFAIVDSVLHPETTTEVPMCTDLAAEKFEEFEKQRRPFEFVSPTFVVVAAPACTVDCMATHAIVLVPDEELNGFSDAMDKEGHTILSVTPCSLEDAPVQLNFVYIEVAVEEGI